MISQLNNAALRNVYQNEIKNSDSRAKSVQESGSSKVEKQGDLSKVDQIKNSIDSGEYKVNLQALAEKITDQLL